MRPSNSTVAPPRSVLVFTAALAQRWAWRPWPRSTERCTGGRRSTGCGSVRCVAHAGGRADHLVIRFRYRDEIEALDLFEAVLAPVLFAFAGWVVVALVAVANLVVRGVLHRNRPVKAAFNVAQWMAAAGVGAWCCRRCAEGQGLTGTTSGPSCAALVVMLLVNHLAFSTVIALAQGQSLRRACWSAFAS